MSTATWRSLAASALSLALAGAAAAASPFQDVPRTHWAYKAIDRAVDAGVLEGYDGKFHGEKLINRYQMAVIVKRVLDNVQKAGSPRAAGMASEDVKNLEAMMIEFADELALLNVKVSTLEDSMVELRGEVDEMKMGSASKIMSGGGGLSNAFTGFVSVGLISTDDGTAGVPPVGGFAGGPLTRYTGTTADQTFFTIPQASIALDHEVGDGISLHVQYDYQTDGATAAAGGVGAGQGVGLNEAYLVVEELFGNVGGLVGGFALPWQSWEINGPFRTATNTITPSAKNTLIEAIRVQGIAFTKMKDVDPKDVKWILAIYSGTDFAMQGAAGVGAGGIGAMSDAVGLGALNRSATFDDSFGWALDLQSGDDPEKDWGWRLGAIDLGGDNGAVGAPIPGQVPVAGLANSQEIDGWQAGFWWKNDDVKVQFEYMDLESTGAAPVPGTPGFSTDINTWYLMVNWAVNDDNSITLRYDDWENDVNAAPGTVGAASGFTGDAFTFAWNRKLSDTSMLQFEWVSPDQDFVTNAPGVGASDVDDDIVQLRYKVWF